MDLRQVVMNIDRQFCKDCVKGKEKAWSSYFLNDGVMITGGTKKNIIGKAAIEKAMASVFALPDIDFIWEPDFCEASDDGTLAVTKGTSLLKYTVDGKTIEQHGNYTTIWKKKDDCWKISWDIGN